MLNVLNAIPTWTIMLVTAIFIVAVNELGYALGRLRHAQAVAEDPSALVQSAAFTLAALLLAFSFAVALDRYDARRAALVREANSIGTTYLRTDLLDERTGRGIRNQLRTYVALRIAYARADADSIRRASYATQSGLVQNRMWSLAVAPARRDPHSTTIPLFVTTLNDTIDLSTTEAAILTEHLPDSVMFGLILIVLIAAGMMGFGFGRSHQHAIVQKILYALMLALALGFVFDLDRPQRGFVRVSLEPLLSVEQQIARPR